MRAVILVAATLLVGCRTSIRHETNPCPPARDVPRPPPAPPSDAPTVHGVEQAGFRYEPCTRGGRYRLIRAGKRALSMDDLMAIKTGLLPPTPGPAWTSISDCACDGAPEAGGGTSRLCIAIRLRADDLDPPAIAKLVAGRLQSLSMDDAALGVRIDLHWKPGPRCTPDNPACGPIPVARDKCPADVGYRADSTRVLVFQDQDPGGDQCRHDGECDSSFCESCFSTRELDRTISGDCFYRSGMKPHALCGCVAGRCTFFVPGPASR